MTTRQEKFERDRQNMLSQMGIDNETVEVEAEGILDYEPPEDWTKKEKEAYYKFKQDVLDEGDAALNLLWSNPEEYDRQQKEKKEKEEKAETSSSMFEYLGSLSLYFIYGMVALISLHYGIKYNIVCGIVMLIVQIVLLRGFALLMDFVVKDYR